MIELLSRLVGHGRRFEGHAPGSAVLPLSKQLYLAFGAMLLCVLVIGSAGLYSDQKLAQADLANEVSRRSVAAVQSLLGTLGGMEASAEAFLTSGDERFISEWESGKSRFVDAFADSVTSSSNDAEQVARIDEIRERFGQFITAAEALQGARREMALDRSAAEFLHGSADNEKLRKDANALREVLAVFGRGEEAALAQRAEEVMHRRMVHRYMVMGGMVLALTIVLLCAWVTRRTMRQQLGGEPLELAQMAGEIAAGRLDRAVVIPPGGHASALAGMERMRGSLASIVQAVRGSSDHVLGSSEAIATGAADLSHRGQQQTRGLDGAADALVVLAQALHQTAQHALASRALATQARSTALQGDQQMNEVVRLMGAINASTAQVVDVLQVVESIAFQTSILALNASVEASRAGEAGAAFGVVAAEVRALAERAAVSAGEVRRILSGSTEAVTQGTLLVQRAAETVRGIAEQVSRSADLSAEIAADSETQTRQVDGVVTAMYETRELALRNAPLVGQLSTAAQGLREQAHQLDHQVRRFQLGAQR